MNIYDVHSTTFESKVFFTYLRFTSHDTEAAFHSTHRIKFVYFTIVITARMWASLMSWLRAHHSMACSSMRLFSAHTTMRRTVVCTIMPRSITIFASSGRTLNLMAVTSHLTYVLLSRRSMGLLRSFSSVFSTPHWTCLEAAGCILFMTSHPSHLTFYRLPTPVARWSIVTMCHCSVLMCDSRPITSIMRIAERSTCHTFLT